MKAKKNTLGKNLGKNSMVDVGQIEEEILNNYLTGKNTQQEIATRLRTSRQVIGYHYKKMVKNLGLSKRGGVPILCKNPATKKTPKNNPKEWSYHALQFEIISYHRTQKFIDFLKKKEGTTEVIGSWRLCFYKHKLIVWLKAGQEFTSIDRNKAIVKANQSLIKLLEYIEFRYGFYVVKEKKSSIKLLKHHLSYRNAPEHDIVTEGEMFVQFRRNGQVFMQYDKSKGFKEREYPSQAIFHSDIIETYMDDFLNQPLTNSQLTSRMNDIVTAMEKMTIVIQNMNGGNNEETN